MGSQAVGAFVWGVVASRTSTVAALLSGAVLLAAVAATVPLLPLHERTLRLNRTVGAGWPLPTLMLAPTRPRPPTPIPADGPVTVAVTYVVRAEQVAAFREAMRDVERSRLRTGAHRWRLLRDGAETDRF